ncbi:hypothetical protein [Streptomyces sp. NPDC001275]
MSEKLVDAWRARALKEYPANLERMKPPRRPRHRRAENLRRYFHPSSEAIAEVTSLLAPCNSRR